MHFSSFLLASAGKYAHIASPCTHPGPYIVKYNAYFPVIMADIVPTPSLSLSSPALLVGLSGLQADEVESLTGVFSSHDITRLRYGSMTE